MNSRYLAAVGAAFLAAPMAMAAGRDSAFG